MAEEKEYSTEELVQALAEGGFADIIGGLQTRLGTLENVASGRWVFGDLVASDAAAGVFSWQNTLGTDVLVTRAVLVIKTASSGAGTVSVGQAATSVSSANLIDTLSVAAAGAFDNIGSPGTNGKALQRVLSGQYVTGSRASGATAGLVGRYALQIVNVG